MAEQSVVEAILQSREQKKKSRKLKKGCIKVAKFFLSTAGLAVINGIILVIGAYIFEHLEQTNEQEVCKNQRRDYLEAENATVILLMDMAKRLDGVGAMSGQKKQEVIDEFQRHMESFALSVLDTDYDVSKDCDKMGEVGGPEFDWSFKGSLVFAVTVATTIGEFGKCLTILSLFLHSCKQYICLFVCWTNQKSYSIVFKFI